VGLLWCSRFSCRWYLALCRASIAPTAGSVAHSLSKAARQPTCCSTGHLASGACAPSARGRSAWPVRLILAPLRQASPPHTGRWSAGTLFHFSQKRTKLMPFGDIQSSPTSGRQAWQRA
jgi:hypothetical protein